MANNTGNSGKSTGVNFVTYSAAQEFAAYDNMPGYLRWELANAILNYSAADIVEYNIPPHEAVEAIRRTNFRAVEAAVAEGTSPGWPEGGPVLKKKSIRR